MYDYIKLRFMKTTLKQHKLKVRFLSEVLNKAALRRYELHALPGSSLTILGQMPDDYYYYFGLLWSKVVELFDDHTNDYYAKSCDYLITVFKDWRKDVSESNDSMQVSKVLASLERSRDYLPSSPSLALSELLVSLYRVYIV